MRISKLWFLTFWVLCGVMTATGVVAQPMHQEARIKVAMRMVGHEILLQAGDSTSRVLPIENLNGRYKIAFELVPIFNPDQLILLVDSVIHKTQIALHYVLEVQTCDSDLVVYSFEKNISTQDYIIPCRSRNLPTDCYVLFFSVLDIDTTASWESVIAPLGTLPMDGNPESSNNNLWFTSVFILLFFAVLALNWKPTDLEIALGHLIQLGDFEFDKLNMTLSSANNTMELTSKETDLLLLLHTSVNSTLEREEILKSVWGDEGDYVGRTLDVFISKLRKKLEADDSVKIVNIRGIGYKLILNPNLT